jgi:pSer/pThr/pTyr-binding forkhead associated (FHA) protein
MGVRLRVRSSWTRRTDATEACFELEQTKIVIGRRAGADVQLPHPAVSGAHATLQVEGPRATLVDEASTNGTKVNGARIAPQRAKPLRDGDVIEIGGFTLHVELGIAASGVSAEDTRALALQLLRDAMDPSGDRLSPPRLVVLNGATEGAELVLPPAPSSVVIGRGELCDLQLPDADASREHATITRDHRGVRVRDLGSKNGVLVNGRATRDAGLRDRDELQIGATVLAFEDPAASELDAVVAAPEAEVVLPEPVLVAPTEPEPPPRSESESESERTPREKKPSAVVTDVGAAVATPIQSRVPSTTNRSNADLVVYVLAAVVLALSVAGLVWLLQVG